MIKLKRLFMRVPLSYKLVIVLCILFFLAACKNKTKEELLNNAVILLDESKPSDAIVLLKSALEKDQDFFEARHQLAIAYTSAGEYGQAEKEFQKLLRMNPSLPGIQLELAEVYIHGKKADAAFNNAKHYLALYTPNAEIFELSGAIYALKGNMDYA